MKDRTRVTLTKSLIDEIWKEWNLLAPFERNTHVVAGIVGVSSATVYRVVTACTHASYGNRVWYDSRKWPSKLLVKYLNEEKFAHVIAAKESHEFTKNESEYETDAYTNMKKINNFNSLELEEPKIKVKSDIEYLADAIMKLTEVLSQKL